MKLVILGVMLSIIGLYLGRGHILHIPLVIAGIILVLQRLRKHIDD